MASPGGMLRAFFAAPRWDVILCSQNFCCSQHRIYRRSCHHLSYQYQPASWSYEWVAVTNHPYE